MANVDAAMQQIVKDLKTCKTTTFPHTRSCFGLVMVCLLPSTVERSYGALCDALDGWDQGVYVYPRKYLHCTVATLSSFMSPLNGHLEAYARTGPQAREQTERLYRVHVADVWAALLQKHGMNAVDTTAKTGTDKNEDQRIRDERGPEGPAKGGVDDNEGLSERGKQGGTEAERECNQGKRRKMEGADAKRVNDATADDSRRLALLVSAVRVSPGAGFLQYDNPGGELAALRQCILRASQDAEAWDKAHDTFVDSLQNEGLHDLAAAVDIRVHTKTGRDFCNFKIPGIMHSTIARFVEQPKAAWTSFCGEFDKKAQSWLAGGGAGLKLHVDTVHLAFENRPYMHIPQATSTFLHAFRTDVRDLKSGSQELPDEVAA